MELFDVIKNSAVGELVQNYEIKKERNGLAKEDVENLLKNICEKYEQGAINQVSPDEHKAVKAKAEKLESEVKDLREKYSTISADEASIKENRDLISEILIDSKNRAKKIIDDAEDTAKSLHDKVNAEVVALKQKTENDRKKTIADAEALKKQIIDKATEKALEIEESKKGIIEEAEAEKGRIIAEASDKAKYLEEAGKKKLDESGIESDAIISKAREQAGKMVIAGQDALADAKAEAAELLAKARDGVEKIEAEGRAKISDTEQQAAAIIEKAKLKADNIVANGHYEEEQLKNRNKDLSVKIEAKKNEFADYIKKVESNFGVMSDCLIDFKKDLNIMFLESDEESGEMPENNKDNSTN